MKSIYEQACEETMAHYGENFEIRLTGSRFGLSFHQWDALIRKALHEPMYETPRCTRWRRFDVDIRIAQAEAHRAVA